MIPTVRKIFCALALLPAVLVFSLQAQAARPSNILVIHSYQQELKWVKDMQKAVFDKFEGRSEVQIYTEHLDSKRITYPGYLNLAASFMKYKYGQVMPDVIITTDNNAFELMRRFRDVIFPGVPVVFCGVNFFEQFMLQGLKGFTGVAEVLELGPNIDLMLALYPGTERIFVVNDQLGGGENWQSHFGEAVSSFRNKVEFEFARNSTIEHVEGRIKGLGPDSLVLLGAFFKDSTGRIFEAGEVSRRLARASARPVFCLFDFNVANGVLGGYVINGYQQGALAASMAEQILAGKNPDEIPVLNQGLGLPMFDQEQLIRLSIPESELPPNSVLINTPSADRFMDSRILWASLSVMIVQTLVILWLVYAVRMRTKAESALRELKDGLERSVIDRTSELAEANAKLIESEHKYRDLIERSYDGVTIIQDEKYVYANRQFTDMVGYELDEVLGRNFYDFVHPDYIPELKVRYARRIHGEQVSRTAVLHLLHKNGDPLFVEINSNLVNFGGRKAVCNYVHDTTERTLMERELKSTLAELETIFSSSQVGIMLLRGGRYYYKGNDRLAEILGYDSPTELKGASMLQLHLSEERFLDFGERYFNPLSQGKRIQVEYQLARKDGAPVWCLLSGKAIDPGIPADLSLGVIWTIDDITRQKDLEAQLRVLASTDPLTGLLNRRSFMEKAGLEVSRSIRYSTPLALLMIDLDRFKLVNDRFGHDAGDDALRLFASICARTFREVDIYARLGGEEFAALLPSTDLGHAVAAAERLREAVASSLVSSESGRFSFTISIGVASRQESGDNLERLLKEADKALYRAKENGRNRVETACPEAE